MINYKIFLRKSIPCFLFFINFCGYSQICINIGNEDFGDKVKASLELTNFDLFLLGETHGLAANAELQSMFYSYLNKEKGVDNILIEWGRGEAFLINEYIRTGDKNYLRWTTFGYFNWKKEMDSWEFIRKKCSENTRVYGVDFEREPSFTAAIYFLIDSTQITLKKALKARLDTLKYSSDTHYMTKWVRDNIRMDIINLGINNMLSNKSSQAKFYERDGHMVKYFKSIYKPNEKYFGRFGTMHTQLNNRKVFAGMMASTHKVVVVNIHYHDSWYNQNTKVKYSYLNDKGFFRRKTIRKNCKYFKDLTKCKDFIIELKPENRYLEELMLKGQFLIYLTNKTGL